MFMICSFMSAEALPVSIPAADWAPPLIERQLELLGRLAEAGLQIALAVERQATGELEEGAAPVAADVSLAYARVSRAVRLTVALQSKRIEAWPPRGPGAPLVAGKPPAPPRRNAPAYVRKARVERIVERVIKAEY